MSQQPVVEEESKEETREENEEKDNTVQKSDDEYELTKSKEQPVEEYVDQSTE